MKISVIIPTFNRRGKISTAIDSALSQSGVELEVIVIDDGSTDGTAEWLRVQYAQQPVRVIANARKKGPAGARNTGFIAASGDCIALLDSDDCFLPGHLQQCRQVLEQRQSVGLVFGRSLYEQDGIPIDYMGPNFNKKLALAPLAYSDQEIAIFNSYFFDHLLSCGCYFSLSTVAFRRSVALELMNEDLRIAEDYEYWVRLSRSHQFACLLKPQSIYILHKQNISFETENSAAQHAPSQLAAYEFMLNYPALTLKQTALIKNKMAEVLFNWGYRCRLRRQWREAALLHWRALRLGNIGANLTALLKLPIKAILANQTTIADRQNG